MACDHSCYDCKQGLADEHRLAQRLEDFVARRRTATSAATPPSRLNWLAVKIVMSPVDELAAAPVDRRRPTGPWHRAISARCSED